MKNFKKLWSLCALSILVTGCSGSSSAEEPVESGTSSSSQIVYTNLDMYLEGIWIHTEESEVDGEEIYYVLMLNSEDQHMAILQGNGDTTLDDLENRPPIITGLWELNDQNDLSVTILKRIVMNEETGELSYEDVNDTYSDIKLTDDYRQAFENPYNYYYVDLDEDTMVFIGNAYMKLTSEMLYGEEE